MEATACFLDAWPKQNVTLHSSNFAGFFISVPSGPPEKLHCVALTSTTIQVSWHPPEQHLQNGVISGYKVVYAPHPGLYPLRQ